MSLYLAVFIAFVVANHVESLEYYKEKPPYVKTCRLSDPNFKACHRDSMSTFINQLYVQGIPEVVKEVGRLDPRQLNQLCYNPNITEVAEFSNNLTDLTMKGFSKFIITDYKFNKRDLSMNIKFWKPKISLDGRFSFKGKILGLPLHGAGDFFCEFKNLTNTVRIKNSLYEKDGLTFFNMTSLSVNLKFADLSTNIKVTEGQIDLEDTANELFRLFWRNVISAHQSEINENTNIVLFSVFQKAFDVIPAKFFIEDI